MLSVPRETPKKGVRVTDVTRTVAEPGGTGPTWSRETMSTTEPAVMTRRPEGASGGTAATGAPVVRRRRARPMGSRVAADAADPAVAAANPPVRRMVAVATVLVVDDDPVIQRLLRVNFEMEGYSVIVASDGVEGLERARLERPDIVVLDIMMPRMSGLDVARNLKSDPDTAAIPVMLLSAKAQEADLRAGDESGADGYLTKPFDPLLLLQRVEELIARRPA